MEVFDYVMILLAAVLLSSLVNYFLPPLSVPFVQILFGVLIAAIPFGALGLEFDLEPELFFVLFLSPLVFQSTMAADKKTMQSMFMPIVMAAVGLVFVTIFAAGYFAYLIVPSLPLAAAFALAAALGPTDIMAAEAVSHRVPLPRKILTFLSGESLFSDATGIVCFQFAIIAAATASFNLLQGLGRFLILAVGGLLAGVVLTILKYMLVRWLQSLDIHTASLHISIGILTPFIIYMVAKGLGTSGIMAVFGAGLCHSLFRDKFNPEAFALSNANDNVWSVLSFNLDGLVFVMLGTQLPRTLREYLIEDHETSGWPVMGYALLIFLVLAAIRFAWWALLIKRKTYSDPENPIGVIKSGLIFCVAGARGAVPMAIVLSIPLLLPDGTPFPERDLIILIASGVIAVSLLLTNFVLPLLGDRKPEASPKDTEHAARAEILQTVVERLKKAATSENFTATQIIIRNYYSRLGQQPKSVRKSRRMRDLRQNILIGEKELLLHMVEMGQMDKSAAEHHIEEVNRLINETDKKMSILQLLKWSVRHFIESLHLRSAKPSNRALRDMQKINDRIVRRRMNALNISKDDPAYAVIAAEHEQVVSARMGLGKGGGSETVFEVAANAFYMERVLIQQMMEAERISWKTAKEMQANLTLLEAQLHAE